MYNGRNSMISNAELERNVEHLAELDREIAAVGGLSVWQEIEALKIERLKIISQIDKAVSEGYDPQNLYNEVGIIDEMIAELENPICNDNGVNGCDCRRCNPRSVNRDEALLF